MNDYQTLYLDGLLLPKYSSLTEDTKPNDSMNYTLDGTLQVDFYNRNRRWVLSWKLLTMAEYESIRAKFDLQYTNQQFLTFHINDIDLWTPVYMTIPDIQIKHNGQYVEGFSVTLTEQNAIS